MSNMNFSQWTFPTIQYDVSQTTALAYQNLFETDITAFRATITTKMYHAFIYFIHLVYNISLYNTVKVFHYQTKAIETRCEEPTD